MKTNLHLFTLAIGLCVTLALPSVAGEKHVHITTPKGGRLLENTSPHAEFVIEKDHGVTINFYGEDLKPVAATTQSATVIATPTTGKTTIEFEKKGDALVSKTKLPEGEGYNLVVQFRATPAAKPQNFRFKLDLGKCGECKHAEYACSCGH